MTDVASSNTCPPGKGYPGYLSVPDLHRLARPLPSSDNSSGCVCGGDARNHADYEDVLEERRSLDAALITPEVMTKAIELQRALAHRGQHRVPIPDLVISAAAHAGGLTVLHYDSDFERIAGAGGAAHEWVVPQGSI